MRDIRVEWVRKAQSYDSPLGDIIGGIALLVIFVLLPFIFLAIGG